MRHRTGPDPGPGITISSFASDYQVGARVDEHAHASDQLMFASHGVMEVSAGPRCWLIPPQFALWIPARTPHRIRMAGAVSMRTLYLRRGIARGLPSVCTVLNVRPLLRELILEAVALRAITRTSSLHAAVRSVIVAELQRARSVPTVITLPQDPRALRVAQAFVAEPATREPVAGLCRRFGVTVRTVQRLFVRETGMDFETWRRQVRLMKGIELLVDGQSVTSVAFALGYQQPNPFIKLFRDTLGTTPRSWVMGLKTQDGTDRGEHRPGFEPER